MSKRKAYCSFCRKPPSDVGPLVEGPDGVHICGDCSELCLSIVEAERRRRDGFAWPPGLEELRTRLESVIGMQEPLSNLLATAVHRHYERLSRGQSSSQSAILLIGPDGTSAAILARAMAHSVRVPFASTSANRLTDSNASDRPAESIFYGLLVASDFDASAAQHGLVYIEGAEDCSAQPVLREVLAGRRTDAIASKLNVNVTNILFVCGGRFAGLKAANGELGSDQQEVATIEAMESVGMLRELAACFGTIAWVNPLDPQTLSRAIGCIDFDKLLPRGRC
jgi:ATP-dependent Clp protease ATP-binding subunit ClpX